MAIPTPMYGYPVDKSAEAMARSRSPGVFILYDEAQSFGSSDLQGAQVRDADGALFSLGLGKALSALSGGVLLLRDPAIHARVRALRDAVCHRTGIVQTARLTANALIAWGILREPLFTLARGIGRLVPTLSYERVAMHDPQEVAERSGSKSLPSAYQAALGLGQIGQVDAVLAERRRLGESYERHLRERGFHTYSYATTPTWVRYSLPVADRAAVMAALKAEDIQLGMFLRYSCPDLPAFKTSEQDCPNAARWGRSIVNLPLWRGLPERQVGRVVDALARLRDRQPGTIAWPEPAGGVR